MGRRVLLVGAYVTGPFHPGSMLQLALALVTCLVHLSIQQQLWPWKNFADNYLALGCNLSLVTLFTASIFFKFAILTEIKDIQDAMSHELREDYVLDGQKSVFLTFMIVMSIAGALILLAIIVTVQSGQHARELEQKRRANRILKDQGSLVRQGLRLEVEALNDERRRQQLTSALETMEQSSDALEAANGVFNASGLHPIYWGISKGQLITFREEVKEALKRGDITNPFGSDPDHPFHYAPEKFNDPKIGPNIHMVNSGVIKPITMKGTEKKPALMPGLSYAVQANLATGGLKCELFFSYCWDAGVFELIDNALTAWPERCKGAYICCLSNPQVTE